MRGGQERRGWECAQAGLRGSPTGWGQGRGADGAPGQGPYSPQGRGLPQPPGCPLAPVGHLCCREGANQDSSKEPRPLLTSGGS